MNMKNCILLSLSLLVLSSCSDRQFTLEDKNDIGADRTLPVRMSVGEAFLKSAVQTADDMDGRTFYVYAFRKHEKADYRVTATEDRGYCLLDSSIDGMTENIGGKSVTYDSNSQFVRFNGKSVNWPNGECHKDAYDFFAYYTDGAEVKAVSRGEDIVTVSFTIDGTQDIMLAKAALTKKQSGNLNAADKEAATAYSFSHFCAFRNIYPAFTFAHCLAKLDFEIVTQNGVEVENVSVLSPRNARLTVAAKDESMLGISFTDSKSIWNIDGTEAERYAIELDGECLMLAPSGKYRLYATVLDNGTRKVLSTDFTGKSNEFTGGKEYKMKITVKGSGTKDLTVQQTN